MLKVESCETRQGYEGGHVVEVFTVMTFRNAAPVDLPGCQVVLDWIEDAAGERRLVNSPLRLYNGEDGDRIALARAIRGRSMSLDAT